MIAYANPCRPQHSRVVLAMAIALMCAAPLLSGCSEKTQDVTVFVSGDTAGWITPCGCTSNQSGGLARRATLIRQAGDTAPVLVADVGGAVTGDSPYDLVKLRAILSGQMKMGLDVFNLGGPETQFTAEQLRDLKDDLKVPFVSANLRDADNQPVATASLEFERGGQKILVTGIVDPKYVGADLQATDPYRSVYDVIKETDADRIIVLAYMEESELRDLAKKLPDVDAVLGGPTGQVIPPAMIGHVLVSSSTNKGKFILEMNLPAAGNASADVIEVSSDIDESAEQQNNLKEFYTRLGEADFEPQETQFVSTRLLGSSQQRIAGSKSCAKCHEPDNKVWHDSTHSHAWHSLETTGAQVDPSCQRCHTTGYGLEGGFQNVATSMPYYSVGCENCHGPSHEHAAEPTKRTPFVAREQCITCHDHENSPTFEYGEYWDQIIHGSENIESSEQTTAAL